MARKGTGKIRRQASRLRAAVIPGQRLREAGKKLEDKASARGAWKTTKAASKAYNAVFKTFLAHETARAKYTDLENVVQSEIDTIQKGETGATTGTAYGKKKALTSLRDTVFGFKTTLLTSQRGLNKILQDAEKYNTMPKTKKEGHVEDVELMVTRLINSEQAAPIGLKEVAIGPADPDGNKTITKLSTGKSIQVPKPRAEINTLLPVEQDKLRANRRTKEGMLRSNLLKKLVKHLDFIKNYDATSTWDDPAKENANTLSELITVDNLALDPTNPTGKKNQTWLWKMSKRLEDLHTEKSVYRDIGYMFDNASIMWMRSQFKKGGAKNLLKFNEISNKLMRKEAKSGLEPKEERKLNRATTEFEKAKRRMNENPNGVFVAGFDILPDNFDNVGMLVFPKEFYTEDYAKTVEEHTRNIPERVMNVAWTGHAAMTGGIAGLVKIRLDQLERAYMGQTKGFGDTLKLLFKTSEQLVNEQKASGQQSGVPKGQEDWSIPPNENAGGGGGSEGIPAQHALERFPVATVFGLAGGVLATALGAFTAGEIENAMQKRTLAGKARHGAAKPTDIFDFKKIEETHGQQVKDFVKAIVTTAAEKGHIYADKDQTIFILPGGTRGDMLSMEPAAPAPAPAAPPAPAPAPAPTPRRTPVRRRRGP
ncbi:hypothetical protein ACFLQ2_04960 [archaeon]